MQRGIRHPVSMFHTNKVNREFSVKNGTNLQNAEKLCLAQSQKQFFLKIQKTLLDA
jgi:hypothetical protein